MRYELEVQRSDRQPRTMTETFEHWRDAREKTIVEIVLALSQGNPGAANHSIELRGRLDDGASRELIRFALTTEGRRD